MYKPKKKLKELKEPEMDYSAVRLGDIFKTVTIANTDEMENARREYSLKLNYLERLAYLYELNQLAFGKLTTAEVKKRFNKTIFIGRP